MPKTQKQSGYLVKIEAFVPADLADINALAAIQKAANEAARAIGSDARISVIPTRR